MTAMTSVAHRRSRDGLSVFPNTFGFAGIGSVMQILGFFLLNFFKRSLAGVLGFVSWPHLDDGCG